MNVLTDRKAPFFNLILSTILKLEYTFGACPFVVLNTSLLLIPNLITMLSRNFFISVSDLHFDLVLLHILSST